MKVLMFGWEFPPYVSGGLGTACFGMTRALADERIEILFVMPGSEEPRSDRLLRGFQRVPLPLRRSPRTGKHRMPR